MKKILLPILAFLLCFQAATAQEHPHEFNFFLGGYNSQYLGYSTIRDYSMDLYALYEQQTRISTGAVATLEYNYALLKWLSVGAQFHYGRLKINTWTRISSHSESYIRDMFCFLPEVKLRIPSPAHFRLYGKVAIGISITPRFETNFAYDLVPLGCEWGGQRIYGTAELVFGNVIKGGRIGIGYRF